MKVDYRLTEQGVFEIEQFASGKPFANFFPGVAGLYGIPMWVFYVNRGQGIASFGIESKDKAILEFHPANKAYRYTPLTGFRTFLNVSIAGQKPVFYEPFSNQEASPYKVSTRMDISSHDLTIEEINETLGLKITVNYFTMPHEPFAALVRRVSVMNCGKKDISFSMIDGLPAINPYGLGDWLSKHMSRTVEAWMTVHGADQAMPFYQLKVVVADTPQVTHIEEGNFFLSFREGADRLLPTIVEPSAVFGPACDFIYPETFALSSDFSIPSHQQTANRTPSAMTFLKGTLKPQAEERLVSLFGFAHEIGEVKRIAKIVSKNGYIDLKAKQNEDLIKSIKDMAFIQTSSTAFDQYCGQTFLDNVLRGGLPISLQTAQGPAVFNVYSRKHGDLERDYNFFTLAPTFLSQGNGNYRDVNQNRRSDVFFNTDVQESSVVSFFNLLQADGYNPLVVKGTTFFVSNKNQALEICRQFGIEQPPQQLMDMLLKGFMPGDLLRWVMREAQIKIKPDDFLGAVLAVSRKQEAADPGEGFWTDHWTYNLDLIESFLGIYPDRLQSLFIDRKDFSFYYSDFYSLPRDSRYILTEQGVRQFHAIEEHDKQTQAKSKGYHLRIKGGQGDVYHTTLLVKLMSLIANKVSTLDPSGIGIEMEANKPNWYDALNGLPGLLGSSISETFELKRFAGFTLSAMDQMSLMDSSTFPVFVELADFMEGLNHVLVNEKDPLHFWQKANDLKEHYRSLIRYGINGSERQVSVGEMKKMLRATIERCRQGIERSEDSKGLFATYYYHDVTAYDVLHPSSTGQKHVRAKAFKRHDLPYFLEGFVHAMRVTENKEQAKHIYKGVKQSPLYDKKLKMYKVNADLSKQSENIGRTRVFPAGWLENESIWLHMEYKYLLELLRTGLVEEYFQEIKTCLVPFMDPNVYGRSILENSSFIASSAHEDDALHGTGFVARLSGSTAEWLHMWLIMTTGFKPFSVQQNELSLSLKPILPDWLFTKQAQGDIPASSIACRFLGKMLLVYHNPKRRSTFGDGQVIPQEWTLTDHKGKKTIIKGERVKGSLAEDIRQGKYARLDVLLG